MTQLPSLVAFGALAPWPKHEHLEQLRKVLRQTALFEPLIEAVNDFTLLWKHLVEGDPSLNTVAGEFAAARLAAAITRSTNEPIPEERNIMTIPLTIITQIVQYITYIEHADQASILESVAGGGGIQGYCGGILSALAVASGRSKDEVVTLAATSIRLAFCIGAYIDMDQLGHDTNLIYSTLAVRWKAPTTLDSIQQILLDYPKTYIAAIRDTRDINVTAPASCMEKLQQDLSQRGISALDTGVNGRYHVDVHGDVVAKIIRACKGRLHPRFGEQDLVRSNTDAKIIPRDNTIYTVLRGILADQANWYLTISTSASKLTELAGNPFILSIGGNAIPNSVSKSFSVSKIGNVLSEAATSSVNPEAPIMPSPKIPTDDIYPENAIAVIGMSCKVSGADSIDKLWELLTKGTSMLEQMPKERFNIDDLERAPRGLRFWGNFIKDIESFDHKFFKKSAREAVSMDPQQRILLQTTYQALESSGYFSDPSKPRNIGCYIGLVAVDYDSNMGSYPPTAYSTIGSARAFLPGKISHHFGWSGPSITLDTACSSSAVAIHTACTALQLGECSQAVAGGVSLFTSPFHWENLATAHFLSPSGASKPFDASADGYCRGEGVGLVVLKKLSDALLDGDNVLGVIAGSALNQSDNSVPITVPHSISQSNLYQRACNQAGIDPHQVSFVEAHGTGTSVGDPIEMESIRRIFGGPKRHAPLYVSSIKGNIGHLEGASGALALIKAILQMENRTACLQASFKKLNPRIPSPEEDQMCIPTSNRALAGDVMTAIVNNYGASGNNAAMVLIEAPPKQKLHQYKVQEEDLEDTQPVYPIQIAAASATSLARYCKLLDDFCEKTLSAIGESKSLQLLSNLAFSLARRQNQDLAHMLTLKATSVSQLQGELRKVTAVNDNTKQRPKQNSVVLCFGGQVSEYVALSKRLWQHSSLFRFHLDLCDENLRLLGYPGLYPSIFQIEPITDIVTLQSAIFSTQYACAQAWIGSGLQIDCLIGHSLGQFAALCVSGILSLHDGLKLVAGRASLMQEHWGPEPGSMLAVEADQETLEQINQTLNRADVNHTFEVACYNGPTSHVLVGDKASSDRLEEELKKHGVRYRRLRVSHGFHSRFTEPLIPHLERLASSVAFNEAKIPIETCTALISWSKPTAQLVAAHTRDPVFFGPAVQRIRDRLGPCTFLEAGSDSSVVSMIRRSLNHSTDAINHFIPMDLNKIRSIDKLVDATVDLWNHGHQVQFWNFHRLQASEYTVLHLPPYEFENSKHWLKLAIPSQKHAGAEADASKNNLIAPPAPPVLIRLKDTDSQGYHFDVDPRSEEYQTLVNGHVVVGKVECPLSLFVELASRAVCLAEDNKKGWLLSVQDLHIESSMGLAANRKVEVRLKHFTDGWHFEVTSKLMSSNDKEKSKVVCHVRGIVSLQEPTSVLSNEFARYERLTGHEKINDILNDTHGVSIRGPMVYKVSSQPAKYADFYCNVKSLGSIGNKAAGKVLPPKQIPDCLMNSSIQPHILDSFIQVAGLSANCMQESSEENIFWLCGVDRIQFGPNFKSNNSENSATNAWDILALSSTTSEGLTNDIFVYDFATEKLVLIIFGVRYINISRTSLANLLSGADGSSVGVSEIVQKLEDVQLSEHSDQIPARSTEPQTRMPVAPPEATRSKLNEEAQEQRIPPVKDHKKTISEDICAILEKIVDIPKATIKGNSTFEDLGVDSLMMIEVIGEISSFYKADLPVEDLEQLTDFDSLVEYLHRWKLGGDDVQRDSDNTASSTSSDVAPTSSSVSSVNDNSIELPSLPSIPKETPYNSPADMSLRHNVVDNRSEYNKLFEAQQVFESLRFDIDEYCKQTGFKHFWMNVYPEQVKLVDAYIVEALCELGSDLKTLDTGQQLPSIEVAPRHDRLVRHLYEILVKSDLIERRSENVFVKTTKPVDSIPAHIHFENMLRKYGQHCSETKLLNITGSRLAACLTDRMDPLQLLFNNSENKAIMTDVYENAPMYQAATRILANFLEQSFSSSKTSEAFQILEIGAGTGGTATYLVEYLESHNIKFEYTFTDISSSLVSQAKRTFAGRHDMKFMTLDGEKAMPAELHNNFDVVIASNVIHATKNANSSVANIMPLLREDGFLCLVEITTGLYWFDLVYGLFENWWKFSDGRQHAIADQWWWENTLKNAGFRHVSWTDGNSKEAQTMRLICGFKAAAEKESFKPLAKSVFKRAGIPTETFKFKRVGSLELQADVYYPKIADEPGKQRPIALMVHGGGHLLFSRQDIPMKHVRVLLQRGFLPVSVDYRLCPEVGLFEGPMTDCCDALKWARDTLPFLKLSGPSVEVDVNKLIALGWSSGGLLAMTLGYMGKPHGIKPPDVILPFYCASDLEAEFWYAPIFPEAAEEPPTEIWGILDCIREEPILEYTPVSKKRASALSFTLKDDRARLILHMCWKAQFVPIIINGLPHKSRVSADDQTDWKALPMPPVEKIRECSPYWRILQGDYRTPTFMVHGNLDDWIPYQQSQKTFAALQERGVPCGVLIADQCGHAFDMFPKVDKLGVGWTAMEAAYDFACSQLALVA